MGVAIELGAVPGVAEDTGLGEATGTEEGPGAATGTEDGAGLAEPSCFSNHFNPPISQYALAKASGLFCTYSSHVAAPVFAAHVDFSHSLPAQSPQNVVSKIIRMFLKRSSKSQPWPWNFASGVPKVDGSSACVPFDADAANAVLLRGRNHTEIDVPVHSIAYTPPPAALKSVPYVAMPFCAVSSGALMLQPTFLSWFSAATSQSDVDKLPMKADSARLWMPDVALSMAHPADV